MASRIEEKERAREARLAAEAADRRAQARRANLIRLGLVVALAAIAVVAVVLASGGGKSKTVAGGSRGEQRTAVGGLFSGLPQRGTQIGNPKAPYTLTEFADLQCPVCQAYTLNVLPSVIGSYVKPGRVKMDLKLRTFIGPDSVKAARVAAAAAQQNRIWTFADLFYINQGEENSGYVTPAFLRTIASNTPGLNASKAIADAGSAQAQALLRSAEQLARSLGSNSTPDFYLRKGDSGRLVRVRWSELTPAAFKAALDRAIAQA